MNINDAKRESVDKFGRDDMAKRSEDGEGKIYIFDSLDNITQNIIISSII